MKKLAAAFAILVLVGCATRAEVVGETDEAIRKVAEPILDNILQAGKTDAYADYVRDFDATAREMFPEKTFLAANAQMREMMGEYVAREYLGALNKGQMTIVLWRAKFAGTADDILVKLVLSKRDGAVKVTGLWFQ